MKETLAQFESRKKDHIRIALDQKSQAVGLSGLERVHLTPDSLPEINFKDVEISTSFFLHKMESPFFISSMTAGHQDSLQINIRLAKMAQEKKWAMGVGSQRKELDCAEASSEWRKVRKEAPNAALIGNLGLAQVIQTKTEDIRRLIDNLEAIALFIHLNPLQECIQKEGTPEFKGGLAAIQRLVKELQVPILIKEVGSGLSTRTLEKLKDSGIFAADVAGLGGTHWGRVEGYRAQPGEMVYEASQTFSDWGISTAEALILGKKLNPPFELWASGGVRSGLDGAKLLAIGAQKVGIAQPLMRAAVDGEEQLKAVMDRFDFELKTALFCCGCRNINELQTQEVWTWK
ncbi:MAG: isopentenyl-diphosphate delta-isomerase [Oligoflexia bacterium]|nr:MAG: isopentenyl-diphosphate delta-isomerase [Oligoflexia bacterium]